MSKWLFLLGILSATLARAQTGGLIAFQNDTSSSVSNAFTGTWVTTNDAILVQQSILPVDALT